MLTMLSRASTPSLLAKLIATPELAKIIQALPEQTFSSLIRKIGIEDAGELVALASTRQLVAAFDEDLFTAPRPGERQTLDIQRLVAWLQAICEAGDQSAATRIAQLSESFVADALSRILLVLDNDDLLLRLSEGDELDRVADKALENAHCEEFDHYLLVSRFHDGWDTAYQIILALDTNHRDFLSRILERCAQVSRPTVEDLDLLCSALSAAESLAEDVEAEREDRRGQQGYVEARAARAFLALAQTPLESPSTARVDRDPITRRYFRELAIDAWTRPSPMLDEKVDLLALLAEETPVLLLGSGDPRDADAPPTLYDRLTESTRQLAALDPDRFGELMQELAYLSNVIMAGAQGKSTRFQAHEAAEAALATVALGAFLLLSREKDEEIQKGQSRLLQILRSNTADRLFRRASSHLAQTQPESHRNFLSSRLDLAKHFDPRNESFSRQMGPTLGRKEK